jgi:class 3 adenylate cyclase
LNNYLKKLRKLIENSSALSEEDVKHISIELGNVEEELQSKDRLLEIENGLDEVRTVAMNMKKPEDMLDICRVICRVLVKLNVKEIRNVQTAIFYETKHIHTNYVYFRLADVSLLQDVDYSLQEDVAAFADKMLRGPSEFFTTSFDKAKINEYIKYQDEAGQFVDQYLKTAESLNFYFYSFGTGALGLSTYSPLSDEDVVLFKRFRNVFELAYRRFADIEQAIEQAREAKIEAALERVRARAVAMHRSDELIKASDVFFEQLTLLGIDTIRTGVGIFDAEKETIEIWSRVYTGEHSEQKILGTVPRNINKFFEGCYDAWKNKQPYFTYGFKGIDVKKFYESMKNILSYPDRTEFNDEENFSIFYFPEGSLNVVSKQTLTDDELGVLVRFAGVFGLMYRRFLDLKKAEEQGREANIETSLERVRASAMSMMKPEDLLNVSETLYREFLRLGFSETRNAMINIHDDEKGTFINYDYSDEIGRSITPLYYDIHPVISKQIKEIRKANDAFSETIFEGKDLEGWIEFRRSRGEKDDPRINALTSLHYYFYSIGKGSIGISTFSPISSEKLVLLKRFRNVFSLSYRRYTDIALAEAQAREAKIEAALERVRSRSIGMQRSDELKEVIRVVYEQLVLLKIFVEHAGFIMDYRERDDMLIWLADEHQVPFQITIPYFDSPHWNSFIEAKKKGLDFFTNHLNFEEKNKFYRDLFGFFSVPEDAKEYYFNCPGLAISTVLLDNVGLYIENFSGIPYTDEENATLMRFGKVFQQTYTRFHDLQRAEAQAREAKIEASLERVRAKAMAMHSTDDFNDAVVVVFEELDKLDLAIQRCGIGIIDKDSKSVNVYTASVSEHDIVLKVSGNESMDIHPLLQGAYDGWLNQKDFSYVLREDDLARYYEAVGKSDFKLPESQTAVAHHKDATQYYFVTPFEAGGLFAFRDSEFTDEAKSVLKRFAGVFNLTYKRFLDLQNAEAQAREARIEAALERVRSRAMAMHSSEDLSSAISAFFQELKSLGVMPWRCGVGQIDKETRTTNLTTTSLSGEGDHAEVTGKLRQEGHPVLDKIFEHWKMQTDYFPVLRGKEIEEYYKVTRPQIAYPDYPIDTVQYGHMIFFKEGFVFAWTEKEMSEDELRIFKRFATVLSLTYRRFLDLKEAEAQAQKAQIETALERVRARALAMQQPEELKDVEVVLRHEMGLLAVNELETCSIYIHDENTSNAECRYAIRDNRNDESKLTADQFALDLSDTWVGNEMMKFYKSDAKHTSIVMQGENRREWVKYCERKSVPFRGYYGEDIPDRVYHLFRFSHGTVGTVTEGDISDGHMDLLQRTASVFSLAYSRYRDLTQARTDLHNLKEEKKRSESLLLNILPEEIANELKQFGKSYARKHDEVTILYADIKGFTAIAETLSAQELVTQLDECFRAFDKIVDKHGLEKIRTIGDAYVCACGLPKPVHDNAERTVRAALDMNTFIKGFSMTRQIQDLPAFEFRIGIHTGPVITGVVGLKKFTYDIWGDSVTMAARMEQHGETGKINISGSTYELVKDKFNCVHRGKIEAKNKGEVDMYFVEG